VIESIVVLVTLVVLFGPKRLPVLVRSLGQGIREFRRSLTRRGEASDKHPIALIPSETGASSVGAPQAQGTIPRV
jgi:sec-independent protein translocase protein TatA